MVIPQLFIIIWIIIITIIYNTETHFKQTTDAVPTDLVN